MKSHIVLEAVYRKLPARFSCDCYTHSKYSDDYKTWFGEAVVVGICTFEKSGETVEYTELIPPDVYRNKPLVPLYEEVGARLAERIAADMLKEPAT